jgi:hypothetical protein
LSTGWKLVSFLPSKLAPNSICGTEHFPKFPILSVGVGDGAFVPMVETSSVAGVVAVTVTVRTIYRISGP